MRISRSFAHIILFLLVFLNSGRNCIFSVGTPVFAGMISLPKTGQIISYYPRDDGDIKAGLALPQPRFTIIYCNSGGLCTDQGGDCDGNASSDVVIDNLTGLMWARNGSLGGSSSWSPYLNYSNNLMLCGYIDWRLPNIRELESLVHAGVENQASWLNSQGQGFVNVQSYGYWSSTSLQPVATYAWLAGFWDGNIDDDYTKDIFLYGLPVRSFPSNPPSRIPRTGQTTCFDSTGKIISCLNTGQDGEIRAGEPWPDPRYTDHANGTVTDNLTGLMWLKDANCMAHNYPIFDQEGTVGDGKVTWVKALDFIAEINIGSSYYNCGLGYFDWRLPNRKELNSLVDYSHYLPSLPSNHPFLNVQSGYYWSSTTKADDPGKAWIIGLWDGRIYSTFFLNKSYPSTLPLWPVRGGQISP